MTSARAFAHFGALVRREKLHRGVPDLPLCRQHKKQEKRNEGRGQHKFIERTEAADHRIAHGVRFSNGYDSLAGFRRGLDFRNVLLDGLHPAFHRLRGGAERLAIFRPIGAKLIGAVKQRISHHGQQPHGNQNDDQRTEGARNVQALKPGDHRIEKISQQRGDQQRDEHGRGPVAESDHDSRGDDLGADGTPGDELGFLNRHGRTISQLPSRQACAGR